MNASSESGLCATLISFLGIVLKRIQQIGLPDHITVCFGFFFRREETALFRLALLLGCGRDLLAHTAPALPLLFYSFSAQRGAGDSVVNEDLQGPGMLASGLRREGDGDFTTVAGI